MKIEELAARIELREVVDELAVLGDLKDAKAQGKYFTEDAVLEFQIGRDGELGHIDGRDTIVNAFTQAFAACKSIYHLNGQFTVEFLDETYTKARTISYVQARTINEEDGKEMISLDSEFYTDEFVKVGEKWLIQKRRTTFLVQEKYEKQ